jgi:spore coat protein CotH
MSHGTLVAIVALSLAAALPAHAVTDPIFEGGVLHDVRLTMDPADWQALRDNYRSNQYYAADVSFDGTTLRQVAVRSRGDGSRDPNKPALKVDFNRYVEGQRLRSLKSVSLKNLVQDPSMLRERLAMAVFEGMGLPAPSVSFARLTVNGQDWGVYNVIESVDKTFLESRLGQDGGNLFSYQWTPGNVYDFGWRGGEPRAYVPDPFEPETNEDTSDGADLVAFVRAINETPEAAFAAEMRNWMDVERFLTYLAVENAVQESDGLVGRQGMNNFYLYQYRDQRRFVFIPWDKNTTLHGGAWSARLRLETNVLTRKLLADPAMQRVYVDALRRAASTLVNERYLGALLDSSYRLIREAALADARKPFDNAAFEAAVTGLRGVVAAREGQILGEAGSLDEGLAR